MQMSRQAPQFASENDLICNVELDAMKLPWSGDFLIYWRILSAARICADKYWLSLFTE